MKQGIGGMGRVKTVLGIHDGHNASVCVVRGGEVVYMAQEERHLYRKNFWGFPRESIKRAMAFLELTSGDLDLVAFSTVSGVPRTRAAEETLRSFSRLLTLRGVARMALIHLIGYKKYWSRAVKGLETRRRLLAECGVEGVPIQPYGHHRCHAASAYFAMRVDPDSPHLTLTLDGAGEQNCSTVSIAREGRLDRIARTAIPHSVGSLYAYVTFLMVFMPYEHEYKLMGMAPYCAPRHAEQAADLFRRYVGLRPDGLGFAHEGAWPVQLRMRDLDRRARRQRFDALAAGIQLFTEDLMVEWARRCVEKTGVRKVVCGGGVFMNVKANKRIMELPDVDYLGVVPSCGDESLSYGAAALGYSDLASSRDLQPWGSVYFGDDVVEEEARRALEEKGFPHRKPDDIEKEIAELLVAGHPVARCRGRMEFGARALGNRSILADPSKQDCVRVINRMIKKRDFWMPFAPMILRERMNDYLLNPKNLPSPHMMLSFDTRETFPDFIAAVHNADLTARAQILEESHNPDLYRCVKHFERLTGRGVVLNTSFNLHGYPICKGPREALHVFENSDLEYLALGPFLVTKTPTERASAR